MSEEEIFERHIVVDQPAREDVFEGKGHLRTAHQLARTIVEFDNEDRSIGLEGDWGAGKSTVVQLAANELSEIKKRNYRFFTFDMWSNQTSPFRRTFLEKLIDWGKREFTDDKSRVDKLNELLDRVRDRTVTTESKSFRRLDWFGVLFILLGPMLPLAFAWLSPFSINPTSGSALSLSIFGFCVPAWSVAILLVGFLYVAFIVRVWKRAEDESIKFTDALSMSASLFTKQQENETTTQNIREEDPNEYEFEITLLDILQVLQEDNDRIVVVFDNIDRLPKDGISNAWADIRAVFSGDPASLNTGPRACTAIVPYDRDHVFEAISDGKNNNYSEKDLFRKTFDEIFRVSPPVASNISAHVEATLRKGLPNFNDKNAIYNVTKIFQRSTHLQGRPVTPRQVISFINEISSIFAQWGGRIPLDTIAIFQVFREDIERKPQSLNNLSSQLAPYLVNSNDVDLNRHLAAIAYNVEPQLAYQVLLEGPVSAALVDKDPEQIKNVSRAPGFPQVLIGILETQASSWAKESAVTYAQVAKNLSSIALDVQTSTHVLALYLSGLKDLSTLEIETPEDVQSLRAIVDLCPNNQRSSVSLRLAEWMTNCFDAKEATFDDGNIWVKSLGMLINNTDRRVEAFADPLLNALQLPPNVRFVLGVAYDCDEIGLSFSRFKHSISSKAFLEPLKEICSDDPLTFHYVFKQLKSAKSLNASELLALLQHQHDQLTSQTFGGDEDYFACRAENLIATYGEISSLKKANELLGALSNNGTLAWHAYATKQSSEADGALAATVWLTLQNLKTATFEVGGNTNQPPFGNLHPARHWLSQVLSGSVEFSDAVIDHLASYVISQKMVSRWIGLAAEASPYQRIYSSVFERLSERDDLYSLPIATLLNHYDQIHKIFGDRIDQVLTNTSGIVRSDQLENIDLGSIPIALLRDTANREEDGWKLFHTAVEKALTDSLDENWKNHLASDSVVLTVLSVEATLRDFKLPAHRFQEPFSDLVVELMSGQAQLDSRPNLSEQVLKSIPPRARAAMPKAIADRMANVSTNKETFGYVQEVFPELVDQIYSKSSDDVKVRNFATPAIASAREKGVAFVERHSTSLRSALEKVTDEQRGHFVEVIESVRSEVEAHRINILAGQLGINLKPLGNDPSDGNQNGA
ncbi:P-loop NTPase fold protein [Epibacterium sp. Ofav1-8]|uniref:P-loop NTPase fold protein n=1 Tax=Epibacterium sp. Ofav1-8 TaxID=2917735 RepID=UPI001EF56B32|nr:P-loop NTPase fold protein [Epibacterium sp. Ofav1-8]MCG7622298.1 KAP family NTPase [Epibacterium sp. Ofav1-8]